MNKSQILIALVIISIFGMFSTYFDVLDMFRANSPETVAEKEVRHGEIRQYTKSKKLKTIVNYDNGIKHGTSYLYHDDGKTVMLAMPYEKGKRQGTSKKYYANGQLYAATNYSDDLLHGPRELYYSSGQLKAVINYGNGNPGLGTVEYLLDGKQKNENKIVTNQKGKLIRLTTSEDCKDLKFYIGKLIDDNFFNAIHPDVELLPKSNGIYYVDTEIYTPSYLKFQDIICHCESKQGNPIIMKMKLN